MDPRGAGTNGPGTRGIVDLRDGPRPRYLPCLQANAWQVSRPGYRVAFHEHGVTDNAQSAKRRWQLGSARWPLGLRVA